MNLIDALTAIRARAVDMVAETWPEIRALIHRILPNPLNPIALLPIATGVAVGGKVSDLISISAAITILDVSLRIVDDCADMDDPGALCLSIGIGRAMNCAMSFSGIAIREILYPRCPYPRDRAEALRSKYFQSFFQICQGQDKDMTRGAESLDDYQALVQLKTVAAYELAAVSGALVASSNTHAITRCSECGVHLGWMTQILNDIEGLWFPIRKDDPRIEMNTFPVLLGLSTEHPNSKLLRELCQTKETDRARVCALLDEMNIRDTLMNLALDHRDRAIASLGAPLNPEGGAILKLWLDWFLRNGIRLLQG